MKSIEILAPVGSMEVLEAAIQAGCHAIYCALPQFGARAYAHNFTLEEMKQVICRCHSLDIQVHVTMNTLLFECEIEAAYQQAKTLYAMGVDALIVQDLGLIHLLHERLPELKIHASTQLSVTRPDQIEALKTLGVQRVVLARECTKEQIEACIETGMEVEVFVHGAICICYSGQCLFSALEYDRSGNRGQCAQPCRMPYRLLCDQKEVPCQGDYLLSPKDLSLIEQVRELQNMGVTSIKIEGRMKSREYVFESVQKVRRVLEGHSLNNQDRKDLQVTFNRGFTRGHMFQQTGNSLMNIRTNNHQGLLIGHVLSQKGKRVRMRLQEPLAQNDAIRFVWNQKDFGCYVNYMYDTAGKLISQGKSGDIVEVAVSASIPSKAKVLKTIDSCLQQEVDTLIRDQDRKLPIHCHVSCQGEGHPLVCTLSQNKLRVSVSSEAVAQKAKSHPLDEKILYRQFSKTGDAFVRMASFDCALPDDLFFPLGVLNHLRNEAVEAFYQEKIKTPDVHERPYRVQLPCVEVDRDWIQNGINDLCSQRADLRFNITNSYALACMLQMGYQGALMSLECSVDDIRDCVQAFYKRYGFKAPVWVWVYGKRRLMIMNHCVINTALKDGARKGCALCHQHRFTLKGKDEREYILEGDRHCHMCIFEREAFDQRKFKEMYKTLGVEHFYLFFLDETAAEKAEILGDFSLLKQD